MVNASEIKRPLVALDESQDLVVEIEAGVPDQRPIPEYPQHHLAAAAAAAASLFPWPEGGTRERMPRVGGTAAREEEDQDWILSPLVTARVSSGSAGGPLSSSAGKGWIGVSISERGR